MKTQADLLYSSVILVGLSIVQWTYSCGQMWSTLPCNTLYILWV